MPAFCSPQDLADHHRDLLKHEPRPTDQPLDAIAVAALVKDPNVKLLQAANLIDQYAATAAAAARLDGVSQAYDLIDGLLVRKVQP
jgi:hypothetical protein